MNDRMLVIGLERTSYKEVLQLQRTIAEQRIAGSVPHDVLLLVEHPPVITLGRSARREHLVAPPEELEARGVELHHSQSVGFAEGFLPLGREFSLDYADSCVLRPSILEGDPQDQRVGQQ